MVSTLFKKTAFTFIASHLIPILCLASNNTPGFGRYLGILRHEAIHRDQLAKLDFILSREEAGKLSLSAVLTLHFGDYNSGEYVAYRFDNVQYNLTKQTLTFDQPDSDALIIVRKFGQGILEADFRSNFNVSGAKLILKNEDYAIPEFPLIEPIWGEYGGACKGVDTRLQLETSRSTDDISVSANPFATYRIQGQLGERADKPCGLFGSDSRYCVWAIFNSGSYNFFKTELILHGSTRTIKCSTIPGGLDCGSDCKLKRISSEMRTSERFSPPKSKSQFSIAASTVALKVPTTSIEGEYTGYLHHEYLDIYQPASINILTYEASTSTPEDPKLELSAVAALYFGDANGAESIPYRFETRPYPNPLLAPQFVFKRSGGVSDASLQVTEFGDGVVKGIWYSNLFGRVGDFEMRKNGSGTIILSKEAKVMEPVSQYFEGEDWELNLIIGNSTPAPNNRNPFSPLSIGGWAIFPSITPRKAITGGSYDMYTGKISIQMGENNGFVGNRISGTRLMLKKTEWAFSTPMPANELQLFRVVPTNGGQ